MFFMVRFGTFTVGHGVLFLTGLVPVTFMKV